MIDYKAYDSPFEIIVQKMVSEMSEKVDKECFQKAYNVTQRFGINIDEQKLIAALAGDKQRYMEAYNRGRAFAESHLYNASQVAEILAELFGDTCACNYNRIDSWLPYHCEFSDTCCPNPVGATCWEQYLKFRDQKDKPPEESE